jgi:Skp family chaperone for outer membrane proteins
VSEAIDGGHKAQKDELEQRAKDLLQRNKDLEALYNQARTEEAVFDMVQKLRKDQFHYERDLRRLNAEIQTEYAKKMREVLSDIRVAVRTIAEQGHFELVLRSPDSDNPEAPAPENQAKAASKPDFSTLEPATTAELVARFNRNPVLFGVKTVDITQDVLKKVNEDYQRISGKPPAPNVKQ